MTKSEYLTKLRGLYIVANRSDHDEKPAGEAWTKPAMAGQAGCAAIDHIITQMVVCGAMTADERDNFYDEL